MIGCVCVCVAAVWELCVLCVFNGCNSVKLYRSAHGETRGDYNEAPMMQHLSFRVRNHGNHMTPCRWIFDVREIGWYWETGGGKMSARTH